MSDMTPAQRAWLTKLRDEGALDWAPCMTSLWIALECEDKGWARFESGNFARANITPAGLAALAEAEARDE